MMTIKQAKIGTWKERPALTWKRFIQRWGKDPARYEGWKYLRSRNLARKIRFL